MKMQMIPEIINDTGDCCCQCPPSGPDGWCHCNDDYNGKGDDIENAITCDLVWTERQPNGRKKYFKVVSGSSQQNMPVVLPTASLTKRGVVQLTNDLSDREDLALTPKGAKVIKTELDREVADRANADNALSNRITSAESKADSALTKANEAENMVASLPNNWEDVVDGAINGAKIIFMPIAYAENLNAPGDCTVLLSQKSDKVIMIDTGAPASWSLIKQELSNNKITHVDYFLLTHFHYDHFGNYTNLIAEGYFDSNTEFYLPITPSIATNTDKENEEAFKSAVNSLGAEVIYPTDDTKLSVDDINITFFNCNQEYLIKTNNTDLNNYSVCNYIVVGNTTILMTGDIQEAAQEMLANRGFVDTHCDILKMPHHSWDLSGNYDFFVKVYPKYAVSSSNVWSYQTKQAGASNQLVFVNTLNTDVYCLGYGACNVHIDKLGYKFSDNNSIPIYSSANIKYDIWVDNNYTGEYCDGTYTHPFKTLQTAISYATNKRKTNSIARIKPVTTYISTDEIVVSDVTLLIYNCEFTSILCLRSNVELVDCVVNGGNRCITAHSGIYRFTSCRIEKDLRDATSVTEGRGVALYNGIAYFYNCTISNKRIPLWASEASYVNVVNLKGTNNEYCGATASGSILTIGSYDTNYNGSKIPYIVDKTSIVLCPDYDAKGMYCIQGDNVALTPITFDLSRFSGHLFTLTGSGGFFAIITIWASSASSVIVNNSTSGATLTNNGKVFTFTPGADGRLYCLQQVQ